MKKVYAVALAILPVLSLYKMPVIAINAGLSILLFFSCFLFIPHMFQLRNRRAMTMQGLLTIAFFGYMFLSSEFVYATSRDDLGVFYRLAIFMAVSIPTLLGAASDHVDFGLTRKAIEYVSLFAALCVIAQYVLFYLFHTTFAIGRIFLLPFTGGLEDQYYLAKGIVIDGFFRPSAFFLEPAHYAQYTGIALISVLFPSNEANVNMRKAILLSASLVLCTSGLGVIFMFGIWTYYGMTTRKATAKKKMIIFFTTVTLLAITSVVLSRFEFFNRTVSRFMADGSGGENAFLGRLHTMYFYEELDAVSKVFGTGFQNIPKYTGVYRAALSYYMVGIVELLYSLGFIGALLALLLLLSAILNTGKFSRCVAIFYFALVFTAARLKTVDVVFYMSLVYTGLFARKAEKMNSKGYDRYANGYRDILPI